MVPLRASLATPRFVVLGNVPEAVRLGRSCAGITEAESCGEGAAEDGDDIPEMTEEMLAFSKLPLNGYQQSFEMLQKHPDIYTPGASDALLIAAFNAENDGKHNYAKRCVHQSLLLQYCEKLGTDGVRVFFKR